MVARKILEEVQGDRMKVGDLVRIRLVEKSDEVGIFIGIWEPEYLPHTRAYIFWDGEQISIPLDQIEAIG